MLPEDLQVVLDTGGLYLVSTIFDMGKNDVQDHLKQFIEKETYVSGAYTEAVKALLSVLDKEDARLIFKDLVEKAYRRVTINDVCTQNITLLTPLNKALCFLGEEDWVKDQAELLNRKFLIS